LSFEALLAAVEGHQAEICILQNAPKRSFADLIVVNRTTQELWLIQCKALSSEKSKFNMNAELEKMGYGLRGHSTDQVRIQAAAAAAAFRNSLMDGLRMTTVRYLFCLNFRHTASLVNGVTHEMRTHMPPNVHVLCSAAGFRFDPVDLSYMTENGVQPEEVHVQQPLLDTIWRETRRFSTP
jgi:hypothetical protein